MARLNTMEKILFKISDLKKKKFSTSELAKIWNVSPRDIVNWSARGFIKPEVWKGRGPGTRRMYSLTNAIEVGVLRNLRDYGFNLEASRFIFEESKFKDTIKTVIRDFEGKKGERTHDEAFEPSFICLVDGHFFRIIQGKGLLEGLSRGSESVVVINLHAIFAHIVVEISMES